MDLQEEPGCESKTDKSNCVSYTDLSDRAMSCMKTGIDNSNTVKPCGFSPDYFWLTTKPSSFQSTVLAK